MRPADVIAAALSAEGKAAACLDYLRLFNAWDLEQYRKNGRDPTKVPYMRADGREPAPAATRLDEERLAEEQQKELALLPPGPPPVLVFLEGKTLPRDHGEPTSNDGTYWCEHDDPHEACSLCAEKPSRWRLVYKERSRKRVWEPELEERMKTE